MIKFLLSSLLCSIFFVPLVADSGGEIAVTEESLPQLPVQPEEEKEDQVLIQFLNGIILLGHEESVISGQSTMGFEGIGFEGVEIPGSEQKLRSDLDQYLGKPVTAQTIYDIKSTIYDFYKANGRPLAIVDTPEQEVTSCVLQLKIYETCLGCVHVEGNKYTPSKRLLGYADLTPGTRIDENRLLKNVSFMNRNPFRRVDVVYAPGDEPETTDVILSVKDRRPIRLYSGTDNYGVDPVGENRWYVGFNWANFMGLDSITSYQFTSSYNMHRFYAHTVEYLLYLPWKHVLDIYGGYSQVHPKIAPPVTRNDGWSMQTSGRYVVPLKIYRYLEHEITAGGDFKRTNNTFEFSEISPVFGSNVNLTQLVLGYSGNYERHTFRIDFDGDIYWSPGQWLADQTDKDFSSLRPGAVNHWVYFKGGLVYLQRLPNSFSLSLLASGQISSNPLLPSEQFGLGGFDTVRGYEQRTVNKDNGLLFSMEGRSPAFPIFKKLYPSWKSTDAMQFIAFYDCGWGIDDKALPGGKKVDYLMGIGPGLRYTIEPYFTARFDWGIKLHHKAAYGGGNNMFYFNVTASF